MIRLSSKSSTLGFGVGIGAALFATMSVAGAALQAQGLPRTEGAPVIVPDAPVEPAPAETAEQDEVSLDALFVALANSDANGYQPIQQQIMAIWARADSASMTFLLSRATREMEAENYTRALEYLDDVVRLAPEFAEGWNRRATVYFLMEDYGRSVADIQRTLALEPRHFGALAGLGIILDRLDRDAQALEVFRRALEIHPHLEGATEAVERLAPRVDGRDL